MRKLTGLVLAFILLAAGVALAASWWAGRQFNAPGPTHETARMEVPAGASVRGVVRMLGDRGIVSDARAVALFLLLQNIHPKIKKRT